MTAKEFLQTEEYYGVTSGDEEEIQKAMVDFAKYHVEKALEIASFNLRQCAGSFNSDYYTQQRGILKAYPPHIIK